MKKIFATLFTVLASITFVFAQEPASEKMYLYLHDGTILAWDVTTIDSLNFEQPAVQSITLSDEAVTLYAIGQQHTLTATIAPSVWEGTITYTSANPEVATVANGVITAVAVGTTTITAQAEDKTATCTVEVANANVPAGKEFYPIIMDGITSTALGDKIKADFRPNGVDQHLYVWDNTYAAATTSDLNFFENNGGYTALTVGGAGWAGAGFNVPSPAVTDLVDSILAHPEEYYFHLAIKSTDDYSHCFYIFGLETTTTKFVLGTNAVYSGTLATDFTRDGSWFEYEFCLSKCVADLAKYNRTANDLNLFVAMTEGVVGAQLNIDAVYIYRK